MADDLTAKINAATTRLAQVNEEMANCLKLAADCEQEAREHRKRYSELKDERATLGTALAHNQVLSGIANSHNLAQQAQAAAEASQKQSAELQAQVTETLARLSEKEAALDTLIKNSINLS